MLDNCTYNKVKLLHEFSSQVWFIQKCALNDAGITGDAECVRLLHEVEKDLLKHIEALSRSLGTIVQ